jgi:uncharacterized membrane protein YadS
VFIFARTFYSDLFRLPVWLRAGVQTELFVKIGLVLLGLAAFAISIFWAYRHKGNGPAKHVPISIIWERFPKFVLGFIVASLAFSFLLNPETAQSSGKIIKAFSSFWFNLAFVSIGLETRFSDLKVMDSKRPFYSFLIAQGFNIIFTLGVSYLLFQIMGPK